MPPPERTCGVTRCDPRATQSTAPQSPPDPDVRRAHLGCAPAPERRRCAPGATNGAPKVAERRRAASGGRSHRRRRGVRIWRFAGWSAGCERTRRCRRGWPRRTPTTPCAATPASLLTTPAICSAHHARVIDLRSDTVTHPTPRCAARWRRRRVGDDVFGDDPTVNALEARAAELLGKEAGLFVASGTMGNLVSLMAHLPRGHEAIAGATTHTVMDEAGGHAVVVGRDDPRPAASAPTGRSTRPRSPTRSAIPTDLHEPLTGLVVLENTHAHSGGRPLPLEYERRGRGDRARPRRPAPRRRRALLQRRASRWASRPERAGRPRRHRHLLPVEGPVGADRLGGRRAARRSSRAPAAPASCSAAACARWACWRRPASSRSHDGPDGMIDRLAEDHANARRLAEGLAELDGVRSPGGIAQPGDGPLDPARAVTNFVLFRVGPRPGGVPRRPRGARRADGPLRARPDPRRHPLSASRPPTSTASWPRCADALADRPEPSG